MSKRLLLTTAVGLILGTAAFAQTPTEPAKKAEPNKPVAQQTDKDAKSQDAKPMSRVEKWQADKQTEAAERNIDKNTGAAAPTPANSVPTDQTQSAPNQPAATTAQTPMPTPPPATATKTQPSAGAPNAQAQQTETRTPATNQPAANQAQTPNAAPAATQQTQNNNSTASANTTQASTIISAGVSVTDPQRTRISESVAKANVKPLTKVNFSVSVGTKVPRDVRLHPVPAEVVEIVPQYRDYRFFTVRDEIVIVEPSTFKIVTVLPRHSATASTTPSTRTSSTTSQRKTAISTRDRAAIKKHAAQPRRERTTTTTRQTERDDPRSARAEVRRQLRVGDRLPDSVELYDMPEPAYREAPALREYRYINRGSRTYVIEPRGRTIIEELD